MHSKIETAIQQLQDVSQNISNRIIPEESSLLEKLDTINTNTYNNLLSVKEYGNDFINLASLIDQANLEEVVPEMLAHLSKQLQIKKLKPLSIELDDFIQKDITVLRTATEDIISMFIARNLIVSNSTVEQECKEKFKSFRRLEIFQLTSDNNTNLINCNSPNNNLNVLTFKTLMLKDLFGELIRFEKKELQKLIEGENKVYWDLINDFKMSISLSYKDLNIDNSKVKKLKHSIDKISTTIKKILDNNTEWDLNYYKSVRKFTSSIDTFIYKIPTDKDPDKNYLAISIATNIEIEMSIDAMEYIINATIDCDI